MGKFQELKVWQRAKDLAVYIYKLTEEKYLYIEKECQAISGMLTKLIQ